MKAVTWHGKRDVRVEDVPDPRIEEPTDAVIRVTTSGICGSDLHLYEVLTMFMEEGDILGHEPMGVVEEVGPDVDTLEVGDRVVVPFNISCGHCFMCGQGLFSQCETTQVEEFGKGAALFGYTKLYGQVPGGQAEYLRVPHADFGPVTVASDLPDERFVYLSDVLPTAWQAVEYADIPKGGSVAVFGLGPIGQMAARIARARGADEVIAVDRVPERIALAQRHSITAFDETKTDDVVEAIRESTGGRGTDAVIDAVGMEAHGSPILGAVQKAAGALPDPVAEAVAERAGVDRLAALRNSIQAVRRGGTVSVIGVYGGAADPLPLMEMFDKAIQIRMGQANVKQWIDDLMPWVLDDDDPLGVDDLATHRMSLHEAPRGYEIFQEKAEGAIKVLLHP